MKFNIFVLYLLVMVNFSYAQQMPSEEEKIPFLCTFSKDADKSWGDDDFVQTFFFVVPVNEKKPVYVRVFDPGTGGAYDEAHGEFNSKTKFSVYGGKGAYSNPDARKQDPVGNYKSGIELVSKVFSSETAHDNQWITLGPFNPVEGELDTEKNAYIFKLVVEGLGGDDGNLYRLFLSSLPNNNKSIEGGNIFTYEYSIRLSDDKNAVSHLYPFVVNNVVGVKVAVFDFDDDGIIRIVSVSKKGEVAKSSGNKAWVISDHKVTKEEINASLDVQFIKQKPSRNNNIVVYVTNQFNELMPFYTVPIGGIPKYKFKINVEAENY